MVGVAGCVSKVAGWFAVTWALVGIALLPSCSRQQRKVDACRIHEIRECMSRQEVETLLGRPEHTRFERYDDNNSSKALVLSYKLDDGRSWLIVLNERDELIGSGEKSSAKERVLERVAEQ